MTIQLTDGTNTVTIKTVGDLNKWRDPKVYEHSIPGSAVNRVQKLGTSRYKFSFRGVLTGLARETDRGYLETMDEATSALTFTDDQGDTYNVVIQRFLVVKRASSGIFYDMELWQVS